jgi:hypothetical protein
MKDILFMIYRVFLLFVHMLHPYRLKAIILSSIKLEYVEQMAF